MARVTEIDRLKAKLRERETLEAEIRELQTRERDRALAHERRTHEIAGRVALAFVKSNPDHPVARELMQAVTEEIKRVAERDLFEALSMVHRTISHEAALVEDPVHPQPSEPSLAERWVKANQQTA